MNKSTVAYKGKSKYDEPRSRKYQQRKPGKHRAEMQLIDRAFAHIPKTSSVLDIPCGGGRVMTHLAKQGYSVVGADFSDAMLQIARGQAVRYGLDCPVERQDIEGLTYPDCRFGTVVCFRLFHHFPNGELRARVVRELCRVAKHVVVLSYFSPRSWTSVKRKVRAALGGKKSDRYATPLREVKDYFAANDFRLVKDFAQMPVLHTLHVAVFERQGKDAR